VTENLAILLVVFAPVSLVVIAAIVKGYSVAVWKAHKRDKDG
jgi:hypothetical protein